MASFADTVWNLVERSAPFARRHRIAGLLHAMKPERASESDRRCFADSFRRTLAQNALFLEITRDSLELLESASIRAMPLKGVLFACGFYPSPGARVQSDVDLLVHERDLEKAHRRLRSAGWDEAWPRAYYRDHYHWVYRREGVLLELHWRLKERGRCAPDLARIWDRARRTETGGVAHLEMSPEDLLAYLAVNKAMQCYSSLMDFIDLRMIVERSTIDWDRFVQDARRDGTSAPLWFGLSYASELLGASVPRRVLRLLSPWPLEWVKRAIDRRGGPLRIPVEALEGPCGRIYGALLEGRPAGVAAMLRPLLVPSRPRVQVLARGSYVRYYAGQCRRLFGQMTRLLRPAPAQRGAAATQGL